VQNLSPNKALQKGDIDSMALFLRTILDSPHLSRHVKALIVSQPQETYGNTRGRCSVLGVKDNLLLAHANKFEAVLVSHLFLTHSEDKPSYHQWSDSAIVSWTYALLHRE
jgi:hypothetical protein